MIIMEDQDFDRLLKVCRIRLAEKEREAIKKDIDEVIAYFDTLESIDCSKYEPAYQPIEIPSRKRPDKIEAFKHAGKLLENSKIYRFFIVGPKV
ncbi:MAG: Asp-tRNA(Asn)/Glu-tRNA(Gln) amidotransferase subunit GatC [Candidatus Micrarchaeota archaeon]|nr:Asp-tRNA(Asn)/Glu-tRNA(Gln) amidotransferase subunit GatC [Candidatus Micrarchaeota archaeon]MDE1859152.1 Asp-tRNA(Asn)/Glu-tRNA(Gln) amidotransferase subunit GatC [Candidatus Micrarchaeota archaeon]